MPWRPVPVSAGRSTPLTLASSSANSWPSARFDEMVAGDDEDIVAAFALTASHDPDNSYRRRVGHAASGEFAAICPRPSRFPLVDVGLDHLSACGTSGSGLSTATRPPVRRKPSGIYVFTRLAGRKPPLPQATRLRIRRRSRTHPHDAHDNTPDASVVHIHLLQRACPSTPARHHPRPRSSDVETPSPPPTRGRLGRPITQDQAANHQFPLHRFSSINDPPWLSPPSVYLRLATESHATALAQCIQVVWRRFGANALSVRVTCYDASVRRRIYANVPVAVLAPRVPPR